MCDKLQLGLPSPNKGNLNQEDVKPCDKSADVCQTILAGFLYGFIICYVLWLQFLPPSEVILNEEEMCGVPARSRF